ncbi:MAG: peptide deformylase [Candidatus Omnitrophica bacterium]|nr:peptide deformylase [Candidatus Omnitrophota bacterium]
MSETGLKIRTLGDQVLRKKAKSVSQVDDRCRDILSAMARLMYDSQGIGLAAPQIGVSESLIVIDCGQGLYKLVNPKIIKKEGRQSMEEGCLSVPGVSIKVKRAKKVIVKARDENGKLVSMEAQDLLACVFQHEIDHLNGKLIVDYASLLEKIKFKKRIAQLKEKAGNEKPSEPKTKPNKL